MNAKIKKYYDNHPYFETYKGWVIRKFAYPTKYLGILVYYTCDVRPGVESCKANHIDMIYDWVDQKIKEGKIQKEDIYESKGN